MHSTCVLVQFSPVRGGNDLVNTRSEPVSSRCHSRLMAMGGIKESQLPVQVWCGCLVFTVVSSSLSHFPQERVPIGNDCTLHSTYFSSRSHTQRERENDLYYLHIKKSSPARSRIRLVSTCLRPPVNREVGGRQSPMLTAAWTSMKGSIRLRVT